MGIRHNEASVTPNPYEGMVDVLHTIQYSQAHEDAHDVMVGSHKVPSCRTNRVLA